MCTDIEILSAQKQKGMKKVQVKKICSTLKLVVKQNLIFMV